MVTEKEIEDPPSEQVIVNSLPEREAVTSDGAGGLVPSSNCWARELISCWRQVQSLRLETGVPSALVKGSGRAELEMGWAVPGVQDWRVVTGRC